MSSNTDVKQTEVDESLTEGELVKYLPVGANPETIQSVSKALEQLQNVAQRSQFPLLVPAVSNPPSAKADAGQDIRKEAVPSLTEYAMQDQVRHSQVGAGRHASRLYNGAKSIW